MVICGGDAWLGSGSNRERCPRDAAHLARDTAASTDQEYEPLHPLLYSLDVFLPFVNLHQEHYWWPKPGSSGEFRAVGMTFTFRGSVVRYYLWAQIIAGWLLSAIFVAGVTGLMRND